jgi:hypothetical protein
MLMADLNLDGSKEIVVKGNDALNEMMTIVDKDGKIISKWYLPNSNWGGSIQSSPAVGNFDDDPELEIVSAGPSEYAGYVNETWNNTGVIYIYNMDGSVVRGWPVYTEGIEFSSPVVGDINKDGKQEIVIGLMYSSDIFPDTKFGGLYAFDRSGRVLPGWPYEKGYNFWSTPALGDIDNDGDLEISASRLNYETSLLHHNGTLAPGWPQWTAWSDYYSSLIGDVDGDSSLDVVTTAGDGFLSSIDYHGGVYGWDSKGLTLKGFPKVTEVDAQAPAVIDDIDNDGKMELAASSDSDYDLVKGTDKNRGSLYVWELDGKYDKSRLPWPTFMHDNQHTGCYDCTNINIPINKTLVKSMISNPSNINVTGTLTMRIQKQGYG